ncbi:MAG: hypothetical protein ABIS84_12250 [Arachnia sp.]
MTLTSIPTQAPPAGALVEALVGAAVGGGGGVVPAGGDVVGSGISLGTLGSGTDDEGAVVAAVGACVADADSVGSGSPLAANPLDVAVTLGEAGSSERSTSVVPPLQPASRSPLRARAESVRFVM